MELSLVKPRLSIGQSLLAFALAETSLGMECLATHQPLFCSCSIRRPDRRKLNAAPLDDLKAHIDDASVARFSAEPLDQHLGGGGADLVGAGPDGRQPGRDFARD